MSRRSALLATAFVVVHLSIGVIHTLAHQDLGVELTRFQDAFVNVAYVGLPLLAAVLVWTPLARAGAVTLLVSILASLLFGVWYHFVFVSPDHVFHLPEGGQLVLFRVTAALMTLVDVGGVLLASKLVRASRGSDR